MPSVGNSGVLMLNMLWNTKNISVSVVYVPNWIRRQDLCINHMAIMNCLNVTLIGFMKLSKAVCGWYFRNIQSAINWLMVKLSWHCRSPKGITSNSHVEREGRMVRLVCASAMCSWSSAWLPKRSVPSIFSFMWLTFWYSLEGVSLNGSCN
jgi:hypothetical protein